MCNIWRSIFNVYLIQKISFLSRIQQRSVHSKRLQFLFLASVCSCFCQETFCAEFLLLWMTIFVYVQEFSFTNTLLKVNACSLGSIKVTWFIPLCCAFWKPLVQALHISVHLSVDLVEEMSELESTLWRCGVYSWFNSLHNVHPVFLKPSVFSERTPWCFWSLTHEQTVWSQLCLSVCS